MRNKSIQENTFERKPLLGTWRFRVLIAAISLVLVSGCGIKWWYDQMDTLLEYRIDQYFDLTSQQEDFVSTQLAKHLVWHRSEGVPVHVAFLTETRNRLADGVTRDDIFWFFGQYREQLFMIVDRLSSDSVLFLTQLNMDQIDYFSEQLKEQNEEYEERLALSREKRLEKRLESTLEFLEDWMGDLSESQETEIRRMSLALPDRLEEWYRVRVQRQQLLVNLLRTEKNEASLRQALLLIMLPQERNAGDPSLGPMIEMILSIDKMATAEQRQQMIDKLKTWIDGLKEVNGRFSG